MIKYDRTTMYTIHKGLSDYRAFSPASISSSKLIGLKPAIPYKIIH